MTDRPDRSTIPDHAEACAEVLERYAKRIRNGRPVEDMAAELLVIVRVMARRT
jgi:hypothetical protein